MPRKTTGPSKNVNIRMPLPLLKEIDDLAKANQRERTSEIKCACRRWVETGARAKEDTLPDENFETLSTAVQELENQIQDMHQEIGKLMQQIACLIAELQKERTAMLGIMEQDKLIIGKLCSGMLEKLQGAPVLKKTTRSWNKKSMVLKHFFQKKSVFQDFVLKHFAIVIN